MKKFKKPYYYEKSNFLKPMDLLCKIIKKLGFSISKLVVPKNFIYHSRNWFVKHIYYRFPKRVINRNIVKIIWREEKLNLQIKLNLRVLTISIPGYLRHYEPKEGDIIIDAGAYPGSFAVWLSKKIKKKGRIYCFEPDLIKANWIRECLYANCVHNVEVINKGIGKETKSNVIKIDDFVLEKKIKKIDFMKWDIEGCEIDAIYGSLETLTNFQPQIAIASYHIVDTKRTYVTLEMILKGLGYKVKTDNPKHLTTYAWK